MSLPIGYLSGFTLATDATDPVNSIDIASGVARDNTNADDIVSTASCVVSLAGQPDGTYHFHAAWNPTTSVCQIIYSNSPTAPVLPSGFTAFRRLGAVVRIGASNWGFNQYGQNFILKATQPVTAPTASASPETIQLAGPVGVQVGALMTCGNVYGGANGYALLSSPDQPASTPGPQNFTTWVYSGSQVSAAAPEVMTNTSAQIIGTLSAASISWDLSLRGWRDYL
jgi:hypothetical protein